MNASMRPVIAVGIIALGVASLVAVSEWRAAHAKEIIPWRHGLSAAQEEARQTHRPVFAYFTAEWCTYCQQMKSTTWADNTVKAALEKFVPVKIDVDADPALAERYQIKGMPAYVILSDSGEAERRREGAMQAEQMVSWLEK